MEIQDIDRFRMPSIYYNRRNFIVNLLGLLYLVHASKGIELQMTALSPASLDSHVKFTAQLMFPNGTIADRNKYEYTWTDDSLTVEKTTSYEYSEIYQTYHPIVMPVGEHRMSLNVVRKDDPTIHVANGSVNFTLTDKVNFKIGANQKTAPSHPKRVFSTTEDIEFAVGTTDNFTKPVYSYSWNITGPSTRVITMNDTSPKILLELPKKGNYSLQVTTVATYDVIDIAFFEKRRTRNGSAVYTFEMKDPVSSVDINTTGTNHYTKEPFNISLACTGSPPYKVQWNITTEDGNITDTGAAELSGPACDLSIERNFTQTGVYFVNVMFVNDVSEMSSGINITIKPPVYPNTSGSAAIPVVCAFIGLGAIILILATYYRERSTPKTETTETADFNFHSYQSSYESIRGITGLLDKVKSSIRNILPGQSSSSRSANVHSQRSYRYGALDDCEL